MSGEIPENLSPPEEGETQTRSEAYQDIDNPQTLLDRIKSRYNDGVGAFEENRRLHSEDLNFVYNSETQGQWDPVVLEARRGKPCYTFNRVIGPVNLVCADMRQTRPAGKFRPASDGASEDVADIYGGLMRSVEQASRADQIYKTQYKFAVAGGFGAMRIGPVFAGDDTFDQVLRIQDIPNPQTVIWDPECNDPCCGDANWCIIADRISRDKHEVEYPGADLSSFYMARDSYGWFTDKEVRVAEYYERIPFEKTIALLDSGDTIDYTAAAKEAYEHLLETGVKSAKVIKTRKVMKWRVMWCRCNGGQILDEPIFYDWKRIPVVRVPGRYINIEGRKKLQSLIRHSKDAQRSYNSRGSDMIERSALTPKAPYLVTETMIKGYEGEWAQANTASRPYLPYNIDPKAVGSEGMPQRTPPIDVPTAALALSQQALSDIQATTGYFDPALGNAEDMNRVSGKALIQHTRRSDLGSFEFIDGFGAAVQLLWEMGGDMIPTVYDTARVERIIGIDGVEKMEKINHPGANDGDDTINDLKNGLYDCTVTIGPSYQTARQEALATLMDAGDKFPIVNQLMTDLILKNLDVAEVDEMVRRARIPLIEQGIVQPSQQEQAQMPPPKQPDPMQVAELQRAQALARRDGAQADKVQSEVKLGPLTDHERIIEIAGKHLANLVLAQKLGQPDAAAAAEDSQGSQPRTA
jgi:hypothetical protein